MSSATPADETQSRSSLNEMERLAEDQAVAIVQLKEKLKRLEEERVQLEEKEKKVEAEVAKREKEAVRRFIASEFRLAQAKSFIPHKRRCLETPDSITVTDKLQQQQASNVPGKLQKEQASTVTDILQQIGVLNPAVNLVYQKAFEAAKSAKTRLKQSYDDLIAWKFSPDTPSGKRLMSCMRQLLAKNEALGRANEVDRIAALEQEASMQATCIGEFLKTNQELEGVLNETSMDLEGVQGSLFILRQQLNQAEALIDSLKNEYEVYAPNQADALVAAALASLSEIENEEDPVEEEEDIQEKKGEKPIPEPTILDKAEEQERAEDPSPISVNQSQENAIKELNADVRESIDA